MGLFKKKSDPISERAQTLSAEIAALEAQIKKLSSENAKTKAQEPPAPAPLPLRPVPAAPVTPVAPASPQPRLRSTALPHHRQNSLAHAALSHPPEPVFEEVDRNRLQAEPNSSHSDANE